MWQVFAYESIIGQSFIDGRLAGAWTVGDNITGGIDNSLYAVVLNPPIATDSGGANSYIGDDVEFLSGGNVGLRRTITSILYEGGLLKVFYFLVPWAVQPIYGDTYKMWYYDGANYLEGSEVLDVGGNFGNTTSSMTIYPFYTVSESAAENYIGRYVIFAHQYNYSLGEQISGIVYSGGQLKGFRFASSFPNAPVPGQMFHMVYHDSSFGPARAYNQTVNFRREIENIVFETDIEVGFSRCTVTLNQYTDRMGRLYQTLPGMVMDVVDAWGNTAYFGLIYSVSIDGDRATISAMSLLDTNAWFYIRDLEYVGDDITTTQVIRDILQENPFLNINASNETCIVPDSNFSWTFMQTNGGNNGIGERSWLDSDYTIKDILDEILALGYYYMDSIGGEDLSGEKVVVQCWNHGVPVVRHIARAPKLANVNYYITNQNFKAEFSGMNLESDLSEAESAVIASYSSEDGESLRAITHYNIDLLRRFGPKAIVFSSSEKDSGGTLNAAKAHKQDKSQITGPGSITITGLVKGVTGHPCIPVWKIHAGDTVAFEANIGLTNIFRSNESSPGIFVVGSTRYDVSSGALTLSAYKPARYRDMYDARVKI